MINVKDLPFRAKGDGIANDQKAIQEAIDVASEQGIDRTIYIPAGIYIIGSDSNTNNQPLVIPSNIRLIGEGRGVSTLRLPNNASQTAPAPPVGAPYAGNLATLLINKGHRWWFGSGDQESETTGNIEIAHLTLDGNREGQPILYDPDNSTSRIKGSASIAACALMQVSNVYLHDLEIKNSADSGLLLQSGSDTFESGVNNSRFERLWIHHNGWIALSIVGEASALSFDSCVIEENDNQGAAIAVSS